MPNLIWRRQSQACLSIVRSDVPQNLSWMMIGQVLRHFIQAAYFNLLTRLLGTAEYGVFPGFCFAGLLALRKQHRQDPRRLGTRRIAESQAMYEGRLG
jgi:hypothetical protein